MAEEEDLLSCLLDVAEAELNSLNANTNEVSPSTSLSTKKKSLVEVDLFSKDKNIVEKTKYPKSSLIHDGDTDSSDDECNRNYENSKYSEYGREIKSIFNHLGSVETTQFGNTKKVKNSIPKKPLAQLAVKPSLQPNKLSNVYTDPFFGISIVNPLISSKFLEERLAGRKPVPISQINKHSKTLTKDDDWITAGVICNKSVTKTSSKGNEFIIWTISDLLGDIKTVAVFLFGSAFKEFWKTQPGSVVGILNPTILDKREGARDEATISVHNAQKILIFGQSKDLGTCRTTKKNGDKCTSIVNKSKCEFCVYHIKQEYQKCSQRSDLQAGYSGKGLIALRNKVLGKNEVFYAGKSYMAIPAKQSKKMLKKDQNRLQSLSGITNTNTNKVKPKLKTGNLKAAASFDVCRSQRLKDFETLRKLGVDTEKYSSVNPQDLSCSKEVSMQNSKANAVSILNKLNKKTENSETKKNNPLDNTRLQESLNDIVENDLADFKLPSTANSKDAETNKTKSEKTSEKIGEPTKNTTFSKSLMLCSKPTLSNNGNFIDLNKPLTQNRANRAKMNALKVIEKTGPLRKLDPNNTKGNGVKRKLDEILTNTETNKKLKKIQENEFLSDRFKKMMEIQSRHTDLIEMRDDEEKEKYFKKLEVKEQLEEKMANTYKIDCKAVRCLNCKYTSFSAAEKCKLEKHRLRIFDAIKRFFKCGHCGNRVACLDIIPLNPCNNCNNRMWERTTMMKEKMITNTVALSIRGGEQTFANSIVTDANVNLLVPDED